MRRAVLVVLVALGCDHGSAAAEREAAPAAAKFDAAATAVLPASTPPPTLAAAEPVLAVGPAAVATREARAAAVLELLAGGPTASRIALVDVDVGSTFDQNLRDTVAPRIVQTGGGVPAVRMGPPTVKGGLDKDIVRRIVRAHVNEVRYCYNQTLVVAPDLTGKLEVSFTVAPTGEVTEAAIARSSLPGALGKRVSECTIKAVKRWKFPDAPDGTPVDVVFPFTFAPS